MRISEGKTEANLVLKVKDVMVSCCATWISLCVLRGATKGEKNTPYNSLPKMNYRSMTDGGVDRDLNTLFFSLPLRAVPDHHTLTVKSDTIVIPLGKEHREAGEGKRV